ncbi:MAG TPA: DNA methyltransferase [Smithellaceae bacterium]|nr:DNA methyltransferase [Smithellaceae bacterium]
MIPTDLNPVLITGDARDIMGKAIPLSSVDLIVTSPPYNCKIKYDCWDDEKQYAEYLEFMRSWLTKAYGVLKRDGRIAINLFYEISQPGRGGRVFVISDVWQIMKEIGFGFNGIMRLEENQSERIKYTAWGCYDDKTEVLTDVGFKLFRDVDINRDVFATIDLDTHKMVYQKAFDYIAKPYSGEMRAIKTRTFDLLVTPDHNMVYSFGNDKTKIGIDSMRNIESNGSALIIPQGHDGWDDGKELEFFQLPIVDKVIPNDNVKNVVEPIAMNDWLVFLGLFCTDGNCYHSPENRQYKVSIYQTKEKYIDEISSLLERLPFGFSRKESKGEYYTCSKQLTSYLSKLGDKNNRIIPDFIRSLSKGQIEYFIHGVMIGDGSTSRSQTRLRCPSRAFMEEMATLFIRAGYTISTGAQPLSKSREYNGVVIRGTRDLYTITIKKSSAYHIKRRYNNQISRYVDYTGFVYCVSVPNKTLLVRRNGKITWCGNSWMSASAPYAYNPEECVLIACKDVWKKESKGISTIGRDEFMTSVKGVWPYRAATSTKTQASFDIELPLRAINLLTYKNDIVLDPFSGRGTTGAACKLLGRRYIGIDISSKYNEIALSEINMLSEKYKGNCKSV